MCGMCQYHYDEDHREKAGPLCPQCGRFRLGEDRGGGSEGCYHCFARAAQLDPCERCS